MTKTSQKVLDDKIKQARKKVDVGGIYYHYKNPDKLYVVEFIGLLEATEEICVAYRALYGKGILWIRTLKDFIAKVETKDDKVARFSRAQ